MTLPQNLHTENLADEGEAHGMRGGGDKRHVTPAVTVYQEALRVAQCLSSDLSARAVVAAHAVRTQIHTIVQLVPMLAMPS